MQVDTIIHPKWLLPIRPQEKLLEQHSIAIDHGKIVAIDNKKQLSENYISKKNIHLDSHVLMPGLINAHTHTPMVLLRSLSDDTQLMEWLNNHIWPAEKALVGQEFIKDGMLLGMAEMLKNGITCFSEHYFFPEIAAKTANDFGMRALIGLWVGDLSTHWCSDKRAWFELAEKILSEESSTDELLTNYCFAPHSPYLLEDEDLARLGSMNQKYQRRMHIHLYETGSEVTDSLKKYNKRPMQRLAEQNLINDQLIAVHMVHTNEADLQYLKGSGASIITCPDPNLKLGSGFCDIKSFKNIGLNIAIGTDGAASNNDLDLLAEAKLASLIAKGMHKDPTLFSAFETLEMLTINGAKALGIEHITGSLEIGKSADMIALNLNQLNSYPQHHPISQIVYAANSRQVDDVWIAGKHLLSSNEFTTIEDIQLFDIAKQWQQKTRPFA